MTLISLEIEDVNVVISVHKHESFEIHSFRSQVVLFCSTKAMPRITKADLTATLDASLRRVEFLEHDVESLMSDLSMEEASSKSWMARAVLLEKENKALKAERGQGDRSRSPRRDAVSAAATHRVMRLVQHFERDAVVDEQRETIAKQQREIESLRRGDGPIGEVLLHNWNQRCGSLLEPTVKLLQAQTTPVNSVMASIQRLADAQKDIALWGGVGRYQVDTLSPVAQIPMPE